MFVTSNLAGPLAGLFWMRTRGFMKRLFNGASYLSPLELKFSKFLTWNLGSQIQRLEYSDD